VALTSLIKDRKQFVVRSDPESMRRAVLTLASIVGAIVVLFVISWVVIDQNYFGKHLTTSESLAVSLESIYDGQVPHFLHPTRGDELLINVLRLAIVSGGVLLLASLFRPLRLRGSAPIWHVNQAKKIIEKYSSSSEDYLKLWPNDKHYYFYKDSFVAYKVVRNTAFVLDGAVGKPWDSARLRRWFLQYAGNNGWNVSVIHTNQEEAESWERAGLQKVYIGSEAEVNIAEFVDKTTRNKHFRYVRNKAEKEQLSVERWDAPLGETQLEILRNISDKWLDSGRREYSFVMGYFSESYLRACDVYILKKADEPIAYTNLLPQFQSTKTSIDHMRFVANLSSVSMHYLLMQTIIDLSTRGAKTFNLGLVPLSKLDEYAKNIQEKLLLVVKQLGRRYYSFDGLEQFKGKFSPAWEPRFILWQGTSAQLVALSANLGSAISFPRKKKGNWVVSLAVVAALAYCSFPLAIMLNPQYIWSGYVSSLGQDGQPYAWLFNALDILSGLLASVVFTYLLLKRRAKDTLLKVSLLGGLLGAIGAVLAAVLPLPNGFSEGHVWSSLLNNSATLLHALTSFFNSSGFFVAISFWGIYWFKKTRFTWRTILAFIAVLTATVGFVVGQLEPSLAGVIQRIYIVCYGVWLVTFVADLNK